MPKGTKMSRPDIAATRSDVWKHKREEFIDASWVEELDKSGCIMKFQEK